MLLHLHHVASDTQTRWEDLRVTPGIDTLSRPAIHQRARSVDYN